MKRLSFRSICHNLNFQKVAKVSAFKKLSAVSQCVVRNSTHGIPTPKHAATPWYRYTALRPPSLKSWTFVVRSFSLQICHQILSPPWTNITCPASTVTHQSRTENYFSQIGRSNHRQRRMAPKTMLTRESIASYFGDHLQCGISFCTNSVTYRKLNHIKFPHKMFDIFL